MSDCETGAVGPKRSLTIRPAVISDAPAITAGERRTAAIPGFLNAKPGEIPESAYREKITALQQSKRGLYAVAEEEGSVLGLVFLDPRRLAANAHVCTLTIVVFPEFQGRGVGRALLDHVVRWARDNRYVEKIELTVRTTNERAIRLYRAFGFEEEGRLRRRVKESDGTYRDDFAMALFVDA